MNQEGPNTSTPESGRSKRSRDGLQSVSFADPIQRSENPSLQSTPGSPVSYPSHGESEVGSIKRNIESKEKEIKEKELKLDDLQKKLESAPKNEKHGLMRQIKYLQTRSTQIGDEIKAMRREVRVLRKQGRKENNREPIQPEEAHIAGLTSQLKSLVHAEIENGIIKTEGNFFPYPQVKANRMLIRKCYVDVFDLLIEQILAGRENFAISGTPGIGKSFFFIYILFRFVSVKSTSPWRPQRILYQLDETFECFDLEKLIVLSIDNREAKMLSRLPGTLYIPDGRKSGDLVLSCYVLFISSPRPDNYNDFVKMKSAEEWYFPVWTWDEIQQCRIACHSQLTLENALKRFKIYGGNARKVFHHDYAKIPTGIIPAIEDAKPLIMCRTLLGPTSAFESSHLLFHIMVTDDYKMLHVDIASRYVGLKLLEKYYLTLMLNLSQLFGGDQSSIGGHFFELYGNLVFSLGKRSLKCRCLNTGLQSTFELQSFQGAREPIFKNQLPDKLLNAYYVTSGDRNFPAVDAMSPQGMFQFTIGSRHPIRGVETLRKLCKYYKAPALYFVVPSHIFAKFKKQAFKATQGNASVGEIKNLKQYVVQLPVIKDLENRFASELNMIVPRQDSDTQLF